MKRLGLLLWAFWGVCSWGCMSAGGVGVEDLEEEKPRVLAEPELPESVSAVHEDLLQHYEAVDARYADLEELGDLPDAVAHNLSALRREYLRMQDHHLEWVETEWILKSGEGSVDRRYYWHKAYRDLRRIGEHQEELIALHRRLAQWAGWLGGQELRQRHQVLAQDHRSYEESVRALGEHFWEALHLGADHEVMADPMGDTPREDAPDGVLSL